MRNFLQRQSEYTVKAWSMTGVVFHSEQYALLSDAMQAVKECKADMNVETVHLTSVHHRVTFKDGYFKNTLWCRKSGKSIHSFSVSKY